MVLGGPGKSFLASLCFLAFPSARAQLNWGAVNADPKVQVALPSPTPISAGVSRTNSSASSAASPTSGSASGAMQGNTPRSASGLMPGATPGSASGAGATGGLRPAGTSANTTLPAAGANTNSKQFTTLTDRKKQVITRARWRNSWIFGALSWEESLNLTGPVSSKPTANIYALTAGVSRAYRTPGFEWTTGLRGFYGFADIGVQSATSTYFQKNVNVWGLTLNTGPMLITKSSHAGLGLSFIGFYRSAQWQVPAAGYSIDKKTLIAEGLSLDARWVFGTWCLEQNIAYLPALQSALWQLQIEL